mmetsp:Transcript_32589/g.29445  ORF Transcript_32589/g.29445 Transcript_32589/m.29445 type:complete len:135 (-) Transcript_32589:343-747(-)
MTEEEVRSILANYNANMNSVLSENDMLKEKAQELEKAERENDYKMRKMRDEIENLLSEREHFKEVAIRAEDKLKGREKEIVDAEIAKVNSLTEKSEAGKDEETSAKELVEKHVEDEEAKKILLGIVEKNETLTK